MTYIVKTENSANHINCKNRIEANLVFEREIKIQIELPNTTNNVWLIKNETVIDCFEYWKESIPTLNTDFLRDAKI